MKPVGSTSVILYTCLLSKWNHQIKISIKYLLDSTCFVTISRHHQLALPWCLIVMWSFEMSSQDIKTSFKINLKFICISSMFLVYLATETFVYGLFPVIIIQFSLFSNVYSRIYLGLPTWSFSFRVSDFTETANEFSSRQRISQRCFISL